LIKTYLLLQIWTLSIIRNIFSSTYGCEGSLGLEWTWKSSDPGIDLSSSRVNLSGSNISLLNNSGTILLRIENSAKTTVASTVFNWYSVGSKIYPSDPSGASDWLNSRLQNGDTILFAI